ncbi:hypothetical protein TEA_011504 [Camellia sinensis var. sinensis]|uniref:Gnk2-homologous domain-containing protein n=1 Tax=Camellia sinensis var. sinensis TaxID=542762 RepID=A0A4S4EW10_CAMSN|nr:hypothetical protein TEA_011504 [Camellia sinensis var. sinensis]
MNSVEIDNESNDEFKDLLQRHRSRERKNPVKKNYQQWSFDNLSEIENSDYEICDIGYDQSGVLTSKRLLLTRCVTSGYEICNVGYEKRKSVGYEICYVGYESNGLVMRCGYEICDYGYEICDISYEQNGVGTTTYTCTYQSNLNTLFSSLSSNSTSINGFFYSYAGLNLLDIAYGLLLSAAVMFPPRSVKTASPTDFTPDLIVLDCNNCLGIAISIFPSCCDGSLGAEVLFPSCNVRYEFYRFYNVTDTSPPPSPPPPPVLLPPRPRPASSPGKFQTKHIDSVWNLKINFLVVAGKDGISLQVLIAILLQSGALLSFGDEMSTVQSLQFDLGTIQVTTNNFSDDNKIGEGGFGSIYKVMCWI